MNRDSRMREFGDALRVHRRAGGLTQVEVAARMTDAGHAWHGSTVSKTETGDRPPSLTELHALAAVLAVDLLDLIDGRQVMRAERAATHAAGARMARCSSRWPRSGPSRSRSCAPPTPPRRCASTG